MARSFARGTGEHPLESVVFTVEFGSGHLLAPRSLEETDRESLGAAVDSRARRSTGVRQ